jgi:hypothetical protein
LIENENQREKISREYTFHLTADSSFVHGFTVRTVSAYTIWRTFLSFCTLNLEFLLPFSAEIKFYAPCKGTIAQNFLELGFWLSRSIWGPFRGSDNFD